VFVYVSDSCCIIRAASDCVCHIAHCEWHRQTQLEKPSDKQLKSDPARRTKNCSSNIQPGTHAFESCASCLTGVIHSSTRLRAAPFLPRHYETSILNSRVAQTLGFPAASASAPRKRIANDSEMERCVKINFSQRGIHTPASRVDIACRHINKLSDAV
jgi:hypothetical protein